MEQDKIRHNFLVLLFYNAKGRDLPNTMDINVAIWCILNILVVAPDVGVDMTPALTMTVNKKNMQLKYIRCQ